MDSRTTFYPTYGYLDGQVWEIPLRAWTHRASVAIEHGFADIIAGLHHLIVQERANLNVRLADLLASDIKHETVRITFDNDREGRTFDILDQNGKPLESDLNGTIEGIVRVDAAIAKELSASQTSADGWLSFYTAQGPAGRGTVRLLEPRGESIISDIDDTIKITEIPAGAEIVARNTFFHNFVAAPGMATMYAGFRNTSFHYVSGAPWQLYEPEAAFLLGPAGFPRGTFHLKNLDKNLLSHATWDNLEELAADRFDLKLTTLNQKLSQITALIEHLPDRTFTMFGDSGELDPEVYDCIRIRHGRAIKEIQIRDVVNAQPSGRLAGMKVIPAPIIQKGISQFP